MNENLKISEVVEYHIYDLQEADFTVSVTSDYTLALNAYRNDNCIVYELHIVQYSSEWSDVEHRYRYEWHTD